MSDENLISKVMATTEIDRAGAGCSTTPENTKPGTPTTLGTLVTRVVNDQGRAFNVVLVRVGDRYGLNGALINKTGSSMVEFYDATYEDDPRFAATSGHGQFITRYNLRTLADSALADRRNGQGLDLLGYVPAWKLTSQNVSNAITAAMANE
jgi:hypothetical protein